MRVAPVITAALLIAGLAVAGCSRSTPAADVATTPAAARAETPSPAPRPAPPRRDLSVDEAMGGHTLVRHIGKTDAELRDRLRRESDISAASTYTDRDTAERVVGAALEASDRSFAAWQARTGTRPNFVLHYAGNETIGRSLTRGRVSSTSCRKAVIVLRWDPRSRRFYVLTSYPEESR